MDRNIVLDVLQRREPFYQMSASVLASVETGQVYEGFEDAVQMMAAVHTGADYLVTRNPRDYKAGPLPVLMPAELLALLQPE